MSEQQTYLTLDPSDPNHPDRRIKVAHLVVGLVFLGLAGTWALGASGTITGLDGALAVPLVLVAAGAIGLVAMVAGGIRRRSRGGAERLADDTYPTYDEHEDRDEDRDEDTTVLRTTDSSDTTTYSEEENR